jgi:hypothetical protein
LHKLHLETENIPQFLQPLSSSVRLAITSDMTCPYGEAFAEYSQEILSVKYTYFRQRQLLLGTDRNDYLQKIQELSSQIASTNFHYSRGWDQLGSAGQQGQQGLRLHHEWQQAVNDIAHERDTAQVNLNLVLVELRNINLWVQEIYWRLSNTQQ